MPDRCKACHQEKVRTDAEQKALIHRLNRVEGQIRGIRNMVESNAYCPDILNQVTAVTAALNAFNRELLAAHVRSCVVEDVKHGSPEEANAVIDELLCTIQRMMK